jgi:hypothetical protein
MVQVEECLSTVLQGPEFKPQHCQKKKKVGNSNIQTGGLPGGWKEWVLHMSWGPAAGRGCGVAVEVEPMPHFPVSTSHLHTVGLEVLVAGSEVLWCKHEGGCASECVCGCILG